MAFTDGGKASGWVIGSEEKLRRLEEGKQGNGELPPKKQVSQLFPLNFRILILNRRI